MPGALPRSPQGNRIWNFAMLGVSMSRPGEGRDPSVSAIALIAAARTDVFCSVFDAFCNNRCQGLWVPAFAGTTR
jgi:hypothetical protein